MTETIKKGTQFLAQTQEENGGFLSYFTSEPASFKQSLVYYSVFPSSLILASLASLDDLPGLSELKDRLSQFLLKQKSQHWSYNYWMRNSKESQEMPYPDDLDDTFCTLSALTLYDKQLFDGAVMAKVVALLTAVETDEGGPYRTWLVGPEAEPVWRDVDLAVNSNVAYFLSLHEVELKKLNTLVESAIDSGRYQSPYYPSNYPVIYFISRFYRGAKQAQVVKFLISKRGADGSWGSSLNTALAVSALLNFGFSSSELKQSVLYLQSKQKQTGAWEVGAFWLDPAIQRQTHYAGSEALTTGLCLEAIAKYQSAVKVSQGQDQTSGLKPQLSDDSEEIYDQVVARARESIGKLSLDLREPALRVLKQILQRDTDRQIVLMPYLFRQSLGSRADEIKEEFIIQLGLVNLYGWIAYTIYDDFLDLEGEVKLLSFANICLRELTSIMTHILPVKSGFPDFFHHVLDKVDSANAWEVSHCRLSLSQLTNRDFKDIPDYGDYENLADRSLGHSLGPAAILFALGHSGDSDDVQNLIGFFKHYLIARQLNDEAHDWEEDLKQGHINAVAVMIINQATSSGSFPGDVDRDLNMMKKTFWEGGVVVSVCERVLAEVKQASAHLREISVISDLTVFNQFLKPLESSAEKAIGERKEAFRFLKTYETF